MPKRMNSNWSQALRDTNQQPQPPLYEPNAAAQMATKWYHASLVSQSPGQWTDDRLKQSSKLIGVTYVALKVLGDCAASAEVKVGKRKPDSTAGGDHDGMEWMEHTHPLVKLLHRPNGKYSGGMLRRMMVHQLCLTGSSLVWKPPNSFTNSRGGKRPSELWSIPTGITQPIAPTSAGKEFVDGGWRVMPYFNYGPFSAVPGIMGTGGAIIPSDEIINTQFPHPLVQYDAYSPLTACALELDTLERLNRGRNTFMRRGANPSAIVELAADLAALPDQPDIDRMTLQFEQKYGGENSVGGIAVLSPGATMKPYSSTAPEMGWTESWEQLVGFVLAIFGLTKSMAFMSESVSYATLYASLQQMNIISLQPLLDIIAQQLTLRLAEYWGDDVLISLHPKKVNDHQIEDTQIGRLVDTGMMTGNELRVKYGLEPMPFGEERVYKGWKPEGAASTTEEGAAIKGPPSTGPVGMGNDAEAERPRNEMAVGSGPPRPAMNRVFATNGNGQH